ncbi:MULTISPECIES: SIS domain-containing protein [unclassified Methylophilus]|jgi:D-sedoheptulose 7-phosphate isomerase|uniref:D-sedoheptulose-7-phosphate isomerase n=1 Tax=unclassified Methylophilus TaxID=2630143 RepID=UPI000375724C|nr:MULTISPECIES: D-sedoheptulose 7-phosphate isomerase [unclassified Methylophilus]HCU84025.1 SIS domain-containing protein [Methylophilus sp.]
MNHIEYLKGEHAAHVAMFQALEPLFPLISDVGNLLRDCIQRGGKVLLCGNGGSAADSQHIAAEIVGRFKKERKGLPSIALTTDTSILTSVGNDYGYDYIFARQVEALCRPEDILIGLTTSGNSANVVRAIEAANDIGATTIGLTGGSGGKLNVLCTHNIVVPSSVTARIQEAHIFIGHCLCEILES